MAFEKKLIHELEKWICENDQCDGNREKRAQNLERVKADDIPFEYAVADL